MTKYLVLICGNEQEWAETTSEWHEQNGAGHRAFAAAAGTALLDGHELEPADKAVTVRADSSGRPKATDGPFIESKEVIGGYYLLEAADMDQAIALAGQIPEASAPSSGVEIRAILA